ncbi:hypothetical protein [Streptomyces sp. NPDC096030]|uniref:hypothetical protein n=1 Tax=Streptomyces sp. NPDC096030 TaxID=3155423 RepID=UPI0033165966
MPYDLGGTVRLQADCRDASGVLTTAGAASLTITLPDGTTTSPTVSAPAQAGQYIHDYVTAQAGRHTVRWLFTTPADAYTDSFDVRESAPPGILSLADAKKHLNKTSSTDDDEIRTWVESITAGIEGFVGPVIVRAVTEVHDFRRARTIALHAPPVLSLTSVDSVLDGGTAYNVGDMAVDLTTGVLRLSSGGSLQGPLEVTYQAGRRVVPAAMTAAARIILQHLWRTQQGPARPQRGMQDFDVSEPVVGFGYAIPNRALQLLEPYRVPPGVG